MSVFFQDILVDLFLTIPRVELNCLDYLLRLDLNVADVRRTVSVTTGGAGSYVRPATAVAPRPDGPTAALSCPPPSPPPPRLNA